VSDRFKRSVVPHGAAIMPTLARSILLLDAPDQVAHLGCRPLAAARRRDPERVEMTGKPPKGPLPLGPSRLDERIDRAGIVVGTLSDCTLGRLLGNPYVRIAGTLGAFDVPSITGHTQLSGTRSAARNRKKKYTVY
jgi:hypothetical protein